MELIAGLAILLEIGPRMTPLLTLGIRVVELDVWRNDLVLKG